MKHNRLFIFLCVTIILAACGQVPASLPSPSPTRTRTVPPTVTSTKVTTPWYLLTPTRRTFPHHIYPTWTPRSLTPAASETPTSTSVPKTPRPSTPAVSQAPTSTSVPNSLKTGGPYLAYIRKNQDETQASIVLFDADGQGRNVIPYPPETNPRSFNLSARQGISSDGKWVAYFTGSAGQCMGLDTPGGKDLALHLMDLNTRQTRLVANLLSPNYPENFAQAARELALPNISAADLQNALACGIFWSVAWSPDGKTLAFAGQMDGLSSDVYVYEPATGFIRRMSSGPQEVMHLRWSDDGQWIINSGAFISGDGAPETTYYTRADGQGSLEFTPGMQPVPGSPQWLNDHLYYTDTYEDMAGTNHLKVIDSTTGKTVYAWDGWFLALSFTPGGNWLTFYDETTDMTGENPGNLKPALVLVNLTTFQQTRVDLPIDRQFPIYSIDAIQSGGTQTFLVRLSPDRAMYALSTDGTLKPTQFQTGQYLYFSPDHREWLALDQQVRRVSVNGTVIQAIDLPTGLYGANIMPVMWRPDKTGLIFAYSGRMEDPISITGLYALDFAKGTIVQIDDYRIANLALNEALWVGGSR